MSEIDLLPQNERELFFRAAIDIKDMPFEIIEKDYWVVWVLKRLFSLEKMKPYLTFQWTMEGKLHATLVHMKNGNHYLRPEYDQHSFESLKINFLTQCTRHSTT